MKRVLLAACLALAVALVEAQPDPVAVRQAAEHVLHEVGYPAVPELVKEVMTGILMLQVECPRFVSKPMVLAKALVKKYQDMTWQAWQAQARRTGMATPDFVRGAMKIVHLSMVADLQKAPLAECR